MTDTAKVVKPQMYRGAYKAEVDEPENTPATQGEPAATPSEPTATSTVGTELSPEEKVYKQRYDSLKAHYDKTVVDLRGQVTQLKGQLGKSTLQNQMPKSAKELEEWRSQYPDLYAMLLTVVRTELKDQEEQLNSRIGQVEQDSAKAKRGIAEAALMKLHPDLPDLLVSKDFHEWVKQQPIDIQKGLYENESDYMLAARYIDLYKADKAVRDAKAKPVKKQPALKDAAASVTSTTPVVDVEASQGKTYRTSEIAKMTRQQFESQEEEIDKARREGRLIND